MDETSSTPPPSSMSAPMENGRTSTNTAKSSLAGMSISAGTLPRRSHSTWVRLNVGGRVFQTTRETLCRESNSFLARLCQDDDDLPSETDESGSYLIDRDPDYFSAVLNYLRHGRLVLDRGLSEEGLLEEAEFYNLPQLIHLCTERLNERNERDEKTKKSITKQVYRVLQCHEDELTSVVSTISDGWKFEQLVAISSFHSTETHPEYLCVVSRECPESENSYANHEGSDRALFLQKKAMHHWAIMPACIPGKCRCFSAIYFRLHTTDFTFAFRCLDYFIRKILGRFLVLLVHALIGFVVFVALTIVLPYESLYKSKWFLYVLVVFAVYLLVNIFYHYHKARNTPPGSPPKVLREPLCRHCNSYKPYGTHHCSICNECVLQMDHHCVWVNTCIGAQNHRHFFQFLIFLIFGCATFVVAASNTFYFNYWHPYTSAEYCSMRELEWLPWFDAFCANEIARFVSLAMLFTYFLCVIIFFLVGSLFYWNFVLISAGFTYIELLGYMDKRCAETAETYQLDVIFQQQQQLRWRQLVNIIFCPLSNSDFACNWRRFLGLKLGSGRSFWRHILLPSAHCTFIYEGEFGHTLEQVRVHENMLFQPGSRRSHTALPFFVPTSNVERGCDEESTSKTNISEALPLQRTIV